VLREYGVDCSLALAVNSYSFLEVCVRVDGVKSQPFTVCAGLRQGCALPQLLFIVEMNWIDSHSQVDKRVTGGSYKINRLLFVDDLVLKASSEWCLQHVLDQFSAACDQTRMKIRKAVDDVSKRKCIAEAG